MTNEHFITEFTSFPQQQGEPQRVGGVAMNGGVERLDREPLVNLVAVGDESVNVGEDGIVIRLVDHRKPPATKVPNLIVPLSSEMRAWHANEVQKEKDWRRRVAAWRYDHPY